jgi:cobalt-zinc-cadmium efflux system membrane fusion protein
MSASVSAHAPAARPLWARVRRSLTGAAFLAAGGLAWWWLATHHFGGGGHDAGHAEGEPASAAAPDDVVSLPAATAAAEVTAVTVGRVPLRDHVTVPGRIDYDARRQIDYAAPVDGIVSQMLVRVRQRVKAGDPLAELSSRDVGMARNDVRKCMADLAIAVKAADWAATIQTNVEAMLGALEAHPPLDEIEKRFGKELLGSYRDRILGSYSKLLQAEKVRASTSSLETGGALSGRIVEERQSNLEVARERYLAECEESRFLTRQDRAKSAAEREQAERVLEISREHLRALVGNSAGHAGDAAAEKPNDDSLSTLVLRSPIDGLVEDIFVARGERVEPGKRMFVVADTTTLWVRALVHERQWTAVEVADGQTVKVTVPGASVHETTATINHVGATVEAESRSVPLVAEIDNDDAHYKPGMFVWVDLPQGALREAVAVPAEAVMRHDGKAFVFVPEGDGRFRRREVQTGIETDTLIEITRGLAEGEEVVSRGSFLLKSRLLLEKEAEAETATAPGFRPGGPGQHQPTEVGQGKVGRMPSLGMKSPGFRPGGPGQHQPTEVGQGKVGRMPSLAVQLEARCSRV